MTNITKLRSTTFLTFVKLLLLALSLVILTGFAYQGVQRFSTVYVQVLRVTNSAEFNGTNDFNGAVTFDGGVTSSGALDMGAQTITNIGNAGTDFNAQGGLTSAAGITATTLTLESVEGSGPVRFGTATAVVSGTTIAHGLGTTPTVAILTAEHTPALTQVVYIISTGSTSITVGIGPGVAGVTTINTVHWMAGK